MSESEGRPQSGPLQFDRAEYTEGSGGGLACAVCARKIEDAYFEINKKVACPACRDRVAEAMGSGFEVGKFAKAAVFGTLAAVLGAGIYFGVRALTGYDFGLVAVVVGVMVGFAVKRGSAGRGGRPFQVLALLLTYCAIVATFMPYVAKGLWEKASETTGESKPANDAEPAVPESAAETEVVDEDIAERPVAAEASAGTDAPANAPAAPEGEVPSLGRFTFAAFVFLGVAFVISFATPVLIGFKSPMMLVIIGIGLYEAWKINRRVPLAISGPFRLAAAEAGGARGLSAHGGPPAD